MKDRISLKEAVNRTALVTGGGRGIGAACAEAFFKLGDNVVIVSRTARELKKIARKIAGKTGAARLMALPGDVGDETFVRGVFAAARKKFGSVDVLVNNAAVLVRKDFVLLTAADWDQTMTTNLRGAFLCSREFLRQFKRPGPDMRRIIVNINSLGGIQGTKKFPGLSAYVVSKFGITGLTEALAAESGKHGAHVIGLAPGAVDTAMLRKAAPHLKPGATPADIACAIIELTESPSLSKLNGTTIPLDTNR